MSILDCPPWLLECYDVENALASIGAASIAVDYNTGSIEWTSPGKPRVRCGIVPIDYGNTWTAWALALTPDPVDSRNDRRRRSTRVDAIADAEALAVKIRDAALVPDLVVPVVVSHARMASLMAEGAELARDLGKRLASMEVVTPSARRG